MGQDAFAKYGITTTIQVTWENLPLIKRILERLRIDAKRPFKGTDPVLPGSVEIHVWAGEGLSDEVIRYYDEMDEDDGFRLPWKHLFESTTQVEFEVYYQQLRLIAQSVPIGGCADKWDIVSVICPILRASVRNISLRADPIVFGQNKTRVSISEELEQIQRRFQEAVQTLRGFGVSETSIQTGWIFSLDP